MHNFFLPVVARVCTLPLSFIHPKNELDSLFALIYLHLMSFQKQESSTQQLCLLS